MNNDKRSVAKLSFDEALANCAKEPIHIPGSIQPHGFLLALNKDKKIDHVSDNVDQFLNRPPQELLSKQLDEILDREAADQLLARVDENHIRNQLQSTPEQIDGTDYDVVTHKSGDRILIEFEPITPDTGRVSLQTMYSRLATLTRRLQQKQSIEDQCEIAASEVHKVTGFDRTMIYMFDDDWHGHVIAETKEDHVKSYLGHHFPASDIPQQARDLYVKSGIRLIADVDYFPAAILNSSHGEQTLDMSYSTLRSVSPVHLQYLRNMGVGASMSTSIVQDGKLWGLICCHGEKATYIPYPVRMIVQLIGEILAMQISVLTAARDLEYKEAVQSSVASLLATLHNDPNKRNLNEALPAAMNTVGASGIALRLDGQTIRHGQTPSPEIIEDLTKWLKFDNNQTSFQCNALSAEKKIDKTTRSVASGLLAAPIGKRTDDMLIWFRPEIVETIKWAGGPDQSKTLDATGKFLNPRKSFDIWKQKVTGLAQPWQDVDIEASKQIADAVHTHQLARALHQALANERLERLEQQNSKNRLRAIVDTTIDGIITINAQGTIIDYNPACEYIFDYSASEAVGKNIKMLMPARYSEHHDHYLKRYSETGQRQIIGSGRLVEGKRKDGSVFPLDLSVSEVQINGETLYSGIVRDITEKKLMEDALQESVKRLQEKNTEVENFVYITSHDFRSPLVNLKGFSKELQRSLNQLSAETKDLDAGIQQIIDDDAATALRFINNAVDKLDFMTSAILELSRTGKRTLSFDYVDTNALAREAVEALQHQINEKGIKVTLEELPMVVADQLSIQQIFGNILDNAVKYTDPARPGIVSISAEETDTEHLFVIEDNGRGIDEKDLPKVFEIFRRAGNTDVAGEGMGMAHVKTLVERHDGKLWCESKAGVGTTFYFSIRRGLSTQSRKTPEAA